MKFLLRRTSSYMGGNPHPKSELMEFDSCGDLQWGIEINTLEELIEFLEDEDTNCTEIIIGKSFNEDYPEDRRIEIYNYYRE